MKLNYGSCVSLFLLNLVYFMQLEGIDNLNTDFFRLKNDSYDGSCKNGDCEVNGILTCEKRGKGKCLKYIHKPILSREQFFSFISGNTTLVFVGDSTVRGIHDSARTFFGCREWFEAMRKNFTKSYRQLDQRHYLDHVDYCRKECTSSGTVLDRDGNIATLNLGFVWAPFLKDLYGLRYWSTHGKGKGQCPSPACKRSSCDGTNNLPHSTSRERNDCGGLFNTPSLSNNFFVVMGGGVHDLRSSPKECYQKCKNQALNGSVPTRNSSNPLPWEDALSKTAQCARRCLESIVSLHKNCWRPPNVRTLVLTPMKLQRMRLAPTYYASKGKHAGNDLLLQGLGKYIQSPAFFNSSGLRQDDVLDLIPFTDNTDGRLAFKNTGDGIHYASTASDMILNEILHRLIKPVTQVQ